jgi:hypothetical protein
LSDKLELARLLTSLGRIDPTPWEERTVREWVSAAVSRPRVRALLSALVRLTSYVNADDVMSAGAAIRQVQQAISANVYYLDDGWQSLVDGLVVGGREIWRTIRRGVKADRLLVDEAVRGVVTADGERIAADAVLVATSPAIASGLAEKPREGSPILCVPRCPFVRRAWTWRFRACPPSARFALGVMRRCTSRSTLLSQSWLTVGALIHAAKYLPPTAAALSTAMRDAEPRSAADLCSRAGATRP